MGHPTRFWRSWWETLPGGGWKLTPGAHLENDLNLSSLDRVELMAAIESRYQVDLGDREFQSEYGADLENLLKNRGQKPRRMTIRIHAGRRAGWCAGSHGDLSRNYAALHHGNGAAKGHRA